MGTYTTNYKLFMPTVGEQGWGALVNGNFTTIDTTMKGLDTRITAVENEVNGALSCTSVTTSGKVTANGGVGTTSLTTSGTITSTGLITANGGVKGNLTGNVTGRLYINGNVSTTKGNGALTYATLNAQSASLTTNGSNLQTSTTITVANYSKISMSYPYRLGYGTYILNASGLSGTINPSISSRTATWSVTHNAQGGNETTAIIYKNGTQVWSKTFTRDSGISTTITLVPGDKIYFTLKGGGYTGTNVSANLNIPSGTTYYLNEA